MGLTIIGSWYRVAVAVSASVGNHVADAARAAAVAASLLASADRTPGW